MLSRSRLVCGGRADWRQIAVGSRRRIGDVLAQELLAHGLGLAPSATYLPACW
jgi:hypothetical protein